MHSDLIAKLEKLTGPGPEVDKLIAANFHVKQITGTWPDWCIDPPVTASLDAAIALMELVLGEDIALELLADVAESAKTDTVNGTLAGLPIALLIATLKALEARDG